MSESLKKANRVSVWIVALLLGGCVIGMFGMCVSALREPPPSAGGIRPSTQSVPAKTQRPDLAGAFVASKEFVKKQLKAPATAKFPWGVSDQAVTYLGDNRYHVKSYVDAQNTFGALIRTHYTCILRDQGGYWAAESFEFINP